MCVGVGGGWEGVECKTVIFVCRGGQCSRVDGLTTKQHKWQVTVTVELTWTQKKSYQWVEECPCIIVPWQLEPLNNKC